jgi:signal transduction histidine kinase/DNA-binding response OmpR family regulator
MGNDRADELPPDCAPASEAGPAGTDSAGRPARILLVDDDELNRALVRAALTRCTDPLPAAARLLEAADLAAARAILAEGPVDIVLLDIRLPDGNGLELAAELSRSGNPAPPAVIALTGALGPDLRSAAMSAGCTAALGKPYQVASLCELISAELSHRAAQRSRDAAGISEITATTERTLNVTIGGSPGKEPDSAATAPGQGWQEPDFRALFESAPGSYLVLTADLMIIAVSDAFLRQAAVSRPDIVGRGIFDIYPGRSADPGDGLTADAADLRSSLDQVRRDRMPHTMTTAKHGVSLPEAEGGGTEVRYTSRVNSPVFGTAGELAYIIHKVEDITGYIQLKQQDTEQQLLAGQLQLRTEQREAEIVSRSRELQSANEALRADCEALRADNAVKKHFLSRVNHELRTPLNTILGFGELLSFSDITAEHREWMSMMLKAAQQLLQLLDEVLDVSSSDAGGLSLSIDAVPVQDVITDALELIRPLALSRGVHLDPPPQLAASQFAAADLQRLRQVLINLLSNAIKYNYPGGKVTVTVGQQPGDRIRISVADTGRGIAEDQLGKLFVPFERLDAAQAGVEGAGLGLALSRHVIGAMGGSTGVTSTPGKGSVFWIDLPAAEPIAVTQPAIGHDPIVACREYPAAKTVLYVEDMVENLRLVEQVLKQRPSATLIPAMLAGVALDLARQHRPDLILLDLRLPDMPGEDVMHELSIDPATRNIPIVILSANATRQHIDQLRAAGATAYLTKPIRVRDLLQTLDGILGGPVPDQAQTGSTQASR